MIMINYEIKYDEIKEDEINEVPEDFMVEIAKMTHDEIETEICESMDVMRSQTTQQERDHFLEKSREIENLRESDKNRKNRNRGEQDYER